VRSRRVLLPAALVAVVLAVLGAIALLGPGRSSAGPSATAATPLRPCTADATWGQQGAVLRADKKTAVAGHRRAEPGVLIQNAGDFAYPSQPVDLRGTGDYTFDFGPLPANFTWPAPDLAFSVQWPTDFPGRVDPPRQSQKIVVRTGGSRYLEAVLPVGGASCNNLVLWYY
jgi:hypothetical protein